MNEIVLIQYLMGYAQALAARVRNDEHGEVTQTVVLTAVFSALALAVGAIIVTKVTAKANSIDLD